MGESNLKAISTDLDEMHGCDTDDLGPDDLPENRTLREVFASNKGEALRGLLEIIELIHETEIVGDGDAANRLRRSLRRARELCSRLETMESLKRIVRRI